MGGGGGGGLWSVCVCFFQIFNITPGVHTLSNVLRFMPRLPHPIVTPKPPASWDWRTKGVISPVQNQGQMGSAEAIVIAGRVTYTVKLVPLENSEGSYAVELAQVVMEGRNKDC